MQIFSEMVLLLLTLRQELSYLCKFADTPPIGVEGDDKWGTSALKWAAWAKNKLPTAEDIPAKLTVYL